MYYKVGVKWRRQKYREGARLPEGLNLLHLALASEGALWQTCRPRPTPPEMWVRQEPKVASMARCGHKQWCWCCPSWVRARPRTHIWARRPWVHILHESTLRVPVPVFPRGRDDPPVPGSSWGASPERPLRRNCGWMAASQLWDGRCPAFSEFPSLPFLTTFPWYWGLSFALGPCLPLKSLPGKGPAFCSMSDNASFPKALLPAVDATSFLKPTVFLPIPALVGLGPTYFLVAGGGRWLNDCDCRK